ncbi:5'-3' exonuclease [Mesomycoplasma lagogenitalium]|uniref:5'-3' exonuclease n=1 Tax=Mesomycoplasma lagogenitalium TaxID=171286 RepID=A0ABY8LT74_9BACT|nr:5'-3' exonuclease [Mesomycoplasma lagogenitalium]WGI36449.1 5'-3' exonuclease [Mesomycoplasma lagogenitalium]
MNKKILLVDANLLLFKSYFGSFRTELKSDDKIQTFAIHTFFSSLLAAINYVEPTHLYLAFDSPEKTKRHELNPDYKAGRAQAPDDLWEQFQWIKKLLDALKIVHQNIAQYEADDLIATLANRYSNENNQIIVYSDDRDLLQLVSPHISVLTKKNKEFLLKTVDNFKDLEGIEPCQMIDFKAIAGDPSDNLKGVPGIGIIGAKKMLNSHQNLDNIYNSLNDFSAKIQQKLLEGKENAYLCRKMVKLNSNAPIEYNFNDLAFNLTYTLEAEEILNYLNLYWLKERII